MPNELNSTQEPCLKCLKKYEADLTNWTPCKNCPWVTNQTSPPKTSPTPEKQCSVCAKSLNFLEPEEGKYLCGKKTCMWHYLVNKGK